MGHRVRATLFALVLLTAAAATGAASFPPHLQFSTLRDDRVAVHYHQGLEPLARRTLALAREVLARHEARYGVRVEGLQVVLADVDDDPNGFASPLPYPLVSLRAAAPRGDEELGNLDDWLRLLVTHELAHVVHLEEARGLLRLGRTVLGRAPFLFPNAATPGWMIEGLATYEETQGSAFGRGRDPDSEMVLRMAALEDAFPTVDQPGAGLDRWPGGRAMYLFGEAFLRDLTRRFGDGVLPRLSRTHAGRPFPFLDERTARRVTGASFRSLWAEWSERLGADARREAAALRRAGLTGSRPLTSTGIRQYGARPSPDGRTVAYTSASLDRFTEIRLMAVDGTGDRRLALRNGGRRLSWTPDGRALVYDELEVHGLFATHYDLRVVDVASGEVRTLTRGLRARDPDVSPDGSTVVFARQRAGGSDLALVATDGARVRDLVHAAEGEQWSAPRWSPSGDQVVAARWRPGGWLDLVLVDARTGTVQELTRDRARDVEPSFTPDGAYVVFRSDRDGVSNLYALRLADREVFRVTRVLGGAFSPAVAADGRSLVFSSYSARGYDVHVMPFSADALAPAEPFTDRYPEPFPEAPAVPASPSPYRPWRALVPRFWVPLLEAGGDDTRVGAITGGLDPLFRHAYAADVHVGLPSGRVGGRALYAYDRFRPTFALLLGDTTDVDADGTEERTREVVAQAIVPLRRTLRSSQAATLSWRRRRETVRTGATTTGLDLGGLQASWSLGRARRYPFSISPTDGFLLRASVLREAPGLGSTLSLTKVVGEARAYPRLGGGVLGLRAGGGTTFGAASFRRSFALGGFPSGSLFDVLDPPGPAVLRGYPDKAFRGRSIAHANAEWRRALAHPQRGYRLLPFFLRHVHAGVFADAGEVWSDRFRLSDVKTAAGAFVGADLVVGHAVPVTAVLGAARGFAAGRETTVYVRAGLSF